MGKGNPGFVMLELWCLVPSCSGSTLAAIEPFSGSVCAPAPSLQRGKASWLLGVRSVSAHSSPDAPFLSSGRKRRVSSWLWGLSLLTGMCLDEFLRANPWPEVLKHALGKMRSSIPPQAPSGSGHKGLKNVFLLYSEKFSIALSWWWRRCVAVVKRVFAWAGKESREPLQPLGDGCCCSLSIVTHFF